VALGTHLYVAIEPLEGGRAMRWLSVSLAAAPPGSEARPTGRRGERPPAPPAPQPRVPTESASSVLDRLEMPEEAARFIADRLWTGAALIVSDQGISNETGTYTDFIVLTR
jgi:hypothetical protein